MIEKRNARQAKKTDVIKTFDPIHLSFVEINWERITVIKMRLNESFEKLNFNIKREIE